MKKTPIILLLLALVLILTSWKTENGYAHCSPFTLPSDTTKTQKSSPKTVQDTSVAYTDTLGEISVQAKKGLAVKDAIDKSLNNGITQPRQKSISDIIGKKATDYIMHPFAWKERKKEKKHKKDREAIIKLDAAKTYEDELTEAIMRQLREDSIAEAQKKKGEGK